MTTFYLQFSSTSQQVDSQKDLRVFFFTKVLIKVNMSFWLISIFLLYSTSFIFLADAITISTTQNPQIKFPNETKLKPEIKRGRIESAYDSLKSYKETVDQISNNIPQTSFLEIIVTITSRRDNHNMMECLKSKSERACMLRLESIIDWCNSTVPAEYLKGKLSFEKSQYQKEIDAFVLEILDIGIDKFEAASAEITGIYSNFHNCNERLSKIYDQLNNKCNILNEYVKKLLYKEKHDSELKNKIETIKKLYDDLKYRINEEAIKIVQMKVQLSDENQIIKELISLTKRAYTAIASNYDTAIKERIYELDHAMKEYGKILQKRYFDFMH